MSPQPRFALPRQPSTAGFVTCSYATMRDDNGQELFLTDGELSFSNSSWDAEGKVKLMLMRHARPRGHVLHIANSRVSATGGMLAFARKIHADPALRAARYSTIVVSASHVWVRRAGQSEDEQMQIALGKGKNVSIEATLTFVREKVCTSCYASS